jgi:hypothetical protein
MSAQARHVFDMYQKHDMGPGYSTPWHTVFAPSPFHTQQRCCAATVAPHLHRLDAEGNRLPEELVNAATQGMDPAAAWPGLPREYVAHFEEVSRPVAQVPHRSRHA